MTIRRILEDGEFGPQEQQFLDLVYRRTLRRLDMPDRGDPLCEAIARKIIEVHKRGATNPIGISEATITELGLRRSNTSET
jgi:hypothetical protein